MKTAKLITKHECCLDVINIDEEDIDVDFLKCIDVCRLETATHGNITTRIGGEFQGKAIYLCENRDYVLAKDSSGFTILVPLKKK